MNDKFLKLPKEKQLNIINGALSVFGKYEYKKASMEEIAKAAGVSKPLIFHYFNTKKELYLYIYNYGVNVMYAKLKNAHLELETDFFKLMKISTSLKAEVLEEYPALTYFLVKSYYENDEEIKNDIKNFNDKTSSMTYIDFLQNVDRSKFKDNISFEVALNTIIWISDGYMNSKKDKPIIAKDITNEFFKYLDLLEDLFYKEGKK